MPGPRRVRIFVRYYPGRDVLYASEDPPVPATSEELGEDFFVRFRKREGDGPYRLGEFHIVSRLQSEK